MPRPLQNLMSFNWIAQRVANGTLALHGWYFDIGSGQLLAYQANTEQFVSL